MRVRISGLAWLPPLCAFSVFLFEAHRYSGRGPYFIDDPFISMRFAANLVTRGELSFNPGDKVEGYSNLLHVLIHAATFKLQGGVPDVVRGIDGAVRVVFAATLLEALLLGVLAHGARPDGEEDAAWYCTWVLTMASWPFAFWASAGMETPIEGLFYVAIVLGTKRVARAGGMAGGIFALVVVGALLVGVTVLRFEGVIVAIAIALALSLHLARTQRTRSAVSVTAAVVVVAAAYHLWRIAYFGALLPNTYIAKATGGSLLRRLQAGATYCGGWVSLLGGGLGLGVAALAVARTRAPARDVLARIARDPVLLVAGTLVTVKLALIVWGGGDWMPGFRMLVPVTPIALFLLVRSLLSLVKNGAALVTTRPAAIVLALAVVACGGGNRAVFSSPGGISDEGHLKKLPRSYLIAGRLLERSFGGSAEEVAIGEAGLIPFEASHVRFMDLFGLVDRDMARQPGATHRRVHVTHVLERAPVAVLFAHLLVLPPYGPHQYGQELLASPAFHAAYRLVDIGADLEASGWALYLRRDVDPSAHHLVWASDDPRAPGARWRVSSPAD